MARFSQPRSAFGPKALAQLKPIFDDVWKELVSEGVFALLDFDEESTRTRLAYADEEFIDKHRGRAPRSSRRDGSRLLRCARQLGLID